MPAAAMWLDALERFTRRLLPGRSMWSLNAVLLLSCSVIFVVAGVFNYNVLIDHQTRPPLPPGLINLSNTCYLNSVVQCLNSISGFRQALLSASLKKNSMGMELKVLMEKLTRASSARAIKPYGLISSMNIDVDVQEDAEEVMLTILNGVEESTIDGTAPIDEIKFRTLQRIVCANHEHNNDKIAPNFDLSVDCRGYATLEEALKQHFAGELLAGENQYRCSVHGLQNAKKLLYMVDLPSTLIVHLKRFSYDPSTGLMKKVGDAVQIPLRLRMSQFCVQSDSNEGESEGDSEIEDDSDYALSAVIIHEGNLQSGHYFSAVKRDDMKKKWVIFNDQIVHELEEKDVLRIAGGVQSISSLLEKYGMVGEKLKASATGYILFYSRL